MAKRVTKKSFAKRVRVTSKGKMMRRAMGVNHFKTRKSTRNNRDKRKMLTFSPSDAAKISSY